MLDVVGYIDAGSGSYMLAAIASGAAGTWFFIRSKFAKLRGRGGEEAVVEAESVEAEAGTEAEAEAASTDA